MTWTLGTTDFQNAVDNLTKAFQDGVAGIPTATTLSNVSTDLGTEITRIAALGDTNVQAHLAAAWAREQRSATLELLSSGRFMTWLAGIAYATALQNGTFTALDALDFVCSQTSGNTGLPSYVTNNNLLVDQYFADLWGQFVLSVASGAYLRTLGNTTLAAITSKNVFPHSNVDNVQVFTTTGAAAGNLTAGANTLAGAQLSGGSAQPGIGLLEGYAGGTIGASSYTATATYTRLDGTTSTVTFAVVGTATTGTVFTPGASVNAQNVVSVAVSGANTGDVIRFRFKPVRSINA